jgi:hypothetical protein
MIPPNDIYIHPGLCAGQYHDMSGNFGIVGTPVIDKASGTLYVVSRYINPALVDNPVYNGGSVYEKTYTQIGWFTYLYAINITNGVIKNKVLIDSLSVTYPGTGDGSVNGVNHFDSRRQFNRAGLVLSGGVVYVPFAAHCDWNPCHGWVVGYDATSLQLKVVYNTTPNDGRGGIWMSGTAPSVDASGNIYFSTGNAYTTSSPFTDVPSVDSNRGLSVVKIAPNPVQQKVSVSSFYTPSAYISYDNADWDFDIGVMLIPNSTWAFTGLKSGDLLLMSQANLGGYSSNSDNVLSVTSLGGNVSMHSNFSYFRSATTEYLYLASERANIKAFPLIRGNPPTLGTSIDNSTNTPGGSGGYAGGYSSTSSNDTLVNSAIMWLDQADGGCNANQALCPGILRAFQATNIANELWNSDMVPLDALGTHSKMNAPTIANGKVYVPTLSNKMQVYANRASGCTGANIALNHPAVASSLENSSFPASNAFDGNITTRWSSMFTDNEWIYVDLGAVYDVCAITISWEAAFGKDFNLDVSNDASTWTTIMAVTGNNSQNDAYSVTGTGRYVRMQGIHRATGFGYSIYEMVVVGTLHNQCAAPTLSSPTNLTKNSVTLNWQAVAGATSYNLQYKSTNVQYWTTISTNSLSANLSALDCEQDFAYQVQAVCPSGNSSYTPGAFTTLACGLANCLLPTRYSRSDIGAVGIAGITCFNPNTLVYTSQGSGSAIGSGGADAFQYAWINAVVGDDYFVARITSQDATNGNNMVGLMMRDSITPWSRFAYIARTSGNGFVFMYRSVPGGPTVTSNPVAGGPLPYWVKINKTGTTYSGWISSDGFSWVPVGSGISLAFGGGSNLMNTGIATTATNNSLLSTAVLDSYGSGVALPVKFGAFTAVDIDDEYVDLRWTTLTEQLNDHFDVQRSSDGVHFEQIGTVRGAGSTDIPQNYSMQDYHPIQGINYYRLKQIDLNNGYSYSPVIHVRFGKISGPLLFPNPAHTYFTVESGKEPVKEISVLNVSGSELVHMINAAGWNSVNVSTDRIPAGVYLVRIKTDAQIYQQKIIIQ